LAMTGLLSGRTFRPRLFSRGQVLIPC
jgi:hypothetical protein